MTKPALKLVLASASPRRQQLLQQAGLEFVVAPAEVCEAPQPGEQPEAIVRRLACAKARAVAPRFPDAVVLGADTVVTRDGRVFGKPASLAEAAEVLRQLSGAVHDVLTGVCLLRLKPHCEETWVSRSHVHFQSLDAQRIEQYLRLVCPLDKAGAYAIQEHGELLIARLEGSRSNVIGLPVETVCRRLRRIPHPA